MSRARKAGKREPNGRLQRDRSKEAVAETDFQTQLPVLIRRCRDMGWSIKINPVTGQPEGKDTLENLRRAKDQKLDKPWGRQREHGNLTEREYEAADWYYRLRVAYRQSIAAPKSTPAGMDLVLNAAGASGGPENVDRARRLRALSKATDEALRRCHRQCLKSVVAFCIDEQESACAAARSGLRVLAQIFLDGQQEAA